MVTEHRLSIQRACSATGLSWVAYYKVPPLPQDRDAEVIDALNGVVERNGRWGSWKCFDRLRLDGRPWNHKRVWRVYCELSLNIPRRTKRRIPKREPVPLAAAPLVNQGCDHGRQTDEHAIGHAGLLRLPFPVLPVAPSLDVVGSLRMTACLPGPLGRTKADQRSRCWRFGRGWGLPGRIAFTPARDACGSDWPEAMVRPGCGRTQQRLAHVGAAAPRAPKPARSMRSGYFNCLSNWK